MLREVGDVGVKRWAHVLDNSLVLGMLFGMVWHVVWLPWLGLGMGWVIGWIRNTSGWGKCGPKDSGQVRSWLEMFQQVHTEVAPTNYPCVLIPPCVVLFVWFRFPFHADIYVYIDIYIERESHALLSVRVVPSTTCSMRNVMCMHICICVYIRTYICIGSLINGTQTYLNVSKRI